MARTLSFALLHDICSFETKVLQQDKEGAHALRGSPGSFNSCS